MNNEYKADAVFGLSNFGGVTIMLNESGDAVRYQWYEKKPSRWCKIYYNQNSTPYFMIRNRRYHLDNFMRV